MNFSLHLIRVYSSIQLFRHYKRNISFVRDCNKNAYLNVSIFVLEVLAWFYLHLHFFSVVDFRIADI